MDTDPSPAPGAVGLIGLGEIGQVHAPAVRRSRAARLVAVADTVPDRLAPFEAQGIRGTPVSSSPTPRSARSASASRTICISPWPCKRSAYLDAVTAGREPPVTGAAALESIRLLERIYDNAAVLPATGPG